VLVTGEGPEDGDLGTCGVGLGRRHKETERTRGARDNEREGEVRQG